MMIKRLLIKVISVVFIAFSVHCTLDSDKDEEYEKELIKKAIENNIGWALTKDVDILYSCISQDENYLSVNPGPNIAEGFEAVKKKVETVWLNDAFKATHFEVKELKINLSRSGDTAWYFCYLDDFAEWNGTPGSWINARWTGTLEKREGMWRIVQMHISFPQN